MRVPDSTSPQASAAGLLKATKANEAFAGMMQRANLRVRTEDRKYLERFKQGTWKRFVHLFLDECEQGSVAIPHPLPRSLDEGDRTCIEVYPSDLERLQRLFPGLETHQIVHVWVQMLQEQRSAA